MPTLQEICKNRKLKLQNRNGTQGLNERIAELKQLKGQERKEFAEKTIEYLRGLFEGNAMTAQDYNDWVWIINSHSEEK